MKLSRTILRLSLALSALLPVSRSGAQVDEGCWNIYSVSSERYLRRDINGLSYYADVHTPGTDARFYLKRCDPDHSNRFLIFDVCKSYVSSDPSGLVAKANPPDTWGEWEFVAQGAGVYGIRSVAHNRWLSADSFIFGLGTSSSLDDEGKFTLAATTNCQIPAEAIIAANTTVLTNAPDQPVWGIADIHAHPFANLGFGGKIAWGAAFSRFGLENALRNCACIDNGLFPCLTGEQISCLQDALSGCNAANLLSCLPAALSQCNVLATDNLIHGPGGLLDLIGNSQGSGDLLGGHDVGGFPSFAGWPRWDTYNHQQMYYKWIERAYLGGLRLMVMHAVNNEALPARNFTGRLFSGDDMAAVDRQIQAAKDLEKFVDWQSGGPGRGWFRIAYSPAQAREIIANGKLAVVLGIEVSSLFGCRLPGECTQTFVRDQLRLYYDKGVRHIFVVHHFENSFSGPAFFNPFSNVGNRIVNDGWFSNVIHCDDSDFNLNGESITNKVKLWLAALLFTGEVPPHYAAEPAHCDGLGLSPLGEFVIREAMRLNMILDIDHMSRQAAALTLTIAESQSCPVVSGHATFNDLDEADHLGVRHRSERAQGPAEIRRIRDLGGLVAPIVSQENLRRYNLGVSSLCNTSSASIAQAYLYTVDQMRGGPHVHAVAIGTDFNGFASHPKPRFGMEGCPGETDPVVYPFSVHSRVGAGQLGQLQTGDKIFDFNTDGLANVGLLPDLIQDLKNIGLSDADLDPLFRSAEGYLQMWQRIEDRPVLLAELKPGGLVSLCWRNGLGDYVLECTSTLVSPVPWTEVTVPFTTNGNRIFAEVSASAPARFYRLRSASP